METRRGFMVTLAGAPGVWLASQAKTATQSEKKEEEDVAPPEDLMREHGVLNRILLIYDESLRRLAASSADLPLDVVADAAGIIKTFIEEYHEKLEEDHLFPRFEKAHTLADLTRVLRDQHAAGRNLTAQILQHAKSGSVKAAADRDALTAAMRGFIRMYRPHEAREDTVLFPALRQIVSPHEFDALGEQFEDKEHELFGEDGFEHMVERVAGLERRLGIYDLAQFTPR